VTTYLDLLGAACLVIFAAAVWPPACWLVAGVVLLLISWRRASS
jgi:hypothetical protein